MFSYEYEVDQEHLWTESLAGEKTAMFYQSEIQSIE